MDPKKIGMQWQKAVTPVNRKIVLIKEKSHPKDKKIDDKKPINKKSPPVDNKNQKIKQPKDQNQIKNEEKKGIAPQVRKLPPLGKNDTVIFFKNGPQGIHGNGELFKDSEITEKLNIVKRVDLGSNIFADYTEHGKAIILQQGKRGCTAATAAMLIMDHGKKPDLEELRNRNLGRDEDQINDIEKAGLVGVIHSAKNLKTLKKLITNNGSAIVNVNGKIGGHVIIVDNVSDDLSKVRVRDPYHGWEITVKSAAFLKEWDHGKIIQVKGQ